MAPKYFTGRSLSIVYGNTSNAAAVISFLLTHAYGIYKAFAVTHTKDDVSHVHVGVILRDKPQIKMEDLNGFFRSPGRPNPTVQPLKTKRGSFDKKLNVYHAYCMDEALHPGETIGEPVYHKYEPVSDNVLTESSAKLTQDAVILKRFTEGKTLLKQYEDADFNMKAYICKNRDTLVRMITAHKSFLKEMLDKTPEFTKVNFKCPPEAEATDLKAKALVLKGKPNGGKTKYAKTFFKNPLLVRHPDKLKQFDELAHDGIIFDDMSYGHWPRESVIHLMDLEEDTDINVKNSMVTIPAGTPRIFTTNRCLRHYDSNAYDDVSKHNPDKSFLPDRLDELDNAIDRRITVVECEDLRILPGSQPTLPEILRV